MSKSRYNVPRAAIHVGAPAKSFFAAEGYEPERRERVHKSKAMLEAERQAQDAIINVKAEKQQLEQQKDKLVGETQNIKSQKTRLEDKVLQLEEYAAALDIKEEDLIVPTLKTYPLVQNLNGKT